MSHLEQREFLQHTLSVQTKLQTWAALTPQLLLSHIQSWHTNHLVGDEMARIKENVIYTSFSTRTFSLTSHYVLNFQPMKRNWGLTATRLLCHICGSTAIDSTNCKPKLCVCVCVYTEHLQTSFSSLCNYLHNIYTRLAILSSLGGVDLHQRHMQGPCKYYSLGTWTNADCASCDPLA